MAAIIETDQTDYCTILTNVNNVFNSNSVSMQYQQQPARASTRALPNISHLAYMYVVIAPKPML